VREVFVAREMEREREMAAVEDSRMKRHGCDAREGALKRKQI